MFLMHTVFSDTIFCNGYIWKQAGLSRTIPSNHFKWYDKAFRMSWQFKAKEGLENHVVRLIYTDSIEKCGET